MKEEEVNGCQIQEWYPKFKSVSIKTLIHELPERFVDYLLDDSGSFLLPISVLNEDAPPNRIIFFRCQRDPMVKRNNPSNPLVVKSFPN